MRMSYISVIERYHEFQDAIHELMGSILSGISSEHLFDDKRDQCEAIKLLNETYPFVGLLYLLDENGIQVSDNIGKTDKHSTAYTGRGKDRSSRPYYRLVKDAGGIVVTEPYLSPASRKLCVSAAMRWESPVDKSTGILVLDIDLAETIEFLMGDVDRRRYQPFFKGVYTVIVVGLFAVVAVLLFSAFSELATLFYAENKVEDVHLKPFGVIIFLTLALAIFDLGKTTLEEEVLMHKDIFRHSSTRRTITRFAAAILIAVSIESLLLMFKSVLGDGETLIQAVWMMLAAVGLLVGLGLYVYLGAKAEQALLDVRKNEH